MYHEIEGLLGIESMVFDDEELIVGSHHYPYSEIESLKITSAPFFASYGVMTLRTKGKDISIPFYRARKSKLEKALREFEKLRESGEIGGGAKAPDTQTDKVPTATSDPYEELKKLKELLDLNIITQEEFDAKKQTDKVPTATSDPYEELKKLKELLDLNIITQEEFDAKKKKLLDL